MGLLNKIFIIVFTAVFFCSSAGADSDLRQLPFSSSDRILVIAPHPDDEAIGAAGVIQEAVRLNIPVRILYLTNGDSNSLSFIYYKKRPVITSAQALEMGKLRQNEAVEAMKFLGLEENDLIFLGYPDYGILNLFKKYWKARKPYRSILTRVTEVPYPLSLTPGAAYEPQSILEDYIKVLRDFKPTKIFVTHPADVNRDHQAAHLFLKVSLWKLEGEIDPDVYNFFIHATGWPRPLGLKSHLRLDPSGKLDFQGNEWFNFELSPQQLDRKKDVIRYYRTQIPYKPKYLYTFVRANEVFSQITELELHSENLNAESWAANEKEQKTCLQGGCLSDRHATVLRSVVYSLNPEYLNLKIRLNQWPRRGFSVDLYMFGFNKGTSFEEMPKLHVQFNRDMNEAVWDGASYLRGTGTRISRQGNDVLVSIPLELIQRPQKILGSVVVRMDNLPLENSAWTVMGLNYDL